jgi:hypothetical protein
LITPSTIVNDNRLAGTWKDRETRTIQVQQVSGTKLMQEIKDSNQEVSPDMLAYYGKQYMITYTENNLSYMWVGGLVKIGGQYYINLVPDECKNKKGNEEYTINGLDRWTTSSIAKLEWKDNNTATLHFINGDYVREAVLNGKARIKYEYDPLFETFVITASSKELQDFLEKYGNKDILYKGGNTLVLSRKN